MNSQPAKDCKIIRREHREVEIKSGAMTRLAGISQTTAGTDGIHLAISTIGPKSSSSPHHHVNCETAIYVEQGYGRFLSGPRLERSDTIGPGDFIYVPPGAIHQPINDSTEKDLRLIVARNTPVEIVVEYKQ